MTRKDYKKFGDMFSLVNNRIKQNKGLTGEQVWHELLSEMINILKEDNPRFDEKRFIKYIFEEEFVNYAYGKED